MSDWIQVRASELRKWDTIRRTKHARTYTITELSVRETMHGQRVHVTSGDVHLQSAPDAYWWLEVAGGNAGS